MIVVVLIAREMIVLRRRRWKYVRDEPLVG